jgi:PEP-CTERM motif
MMRWFLKASLPAMSVMLLLPAVVRADLPQGGDVAFGLSRSTASETLEIVRGPAAGLGVNVPDPWTTTGFIQSVEWDNFGGISHNAKGNLLGVNFGTSALGGSIYSFSTTNELVTAGQLIGDTTGTGGAGLPLSRLGGLSVSPDNSKIAVTGNDSMSVYVFDYTPGDTMGAGAALANGRVSSPVMNPSTTHGTAWLDNNNLISLNADGQVFRVDATTMAVTTVANVTTSFGSSMFTDIEYNAAISRFVYATFSQFTTATGTINELFVLDPAASFSLVKKVSLTASANTLREIALDKDGNLFLGQFGNTAAGGPRIDVLLDVVTNPAAIADNSSIDWYNSPNSSQFNGLDVSLGPDSPGVDVDFDDNGLVNCADVDSLVNAIVNTPANLSFDLTADGVVNRDDLTRWLDDAGQVNLPSMNPYRSGDANLDGVVDGSDFGIWNSNKFTTRAAWCSGDFTADGVIDGSDFGIWNSNKFTSSDSSLVPEPTSMALILVGLAAISRRRK